jgi:hypothetical protein
MLDIPLQDIIDAHIDAAAQMQEESFLALLQFLLLRGSGPVDPKGFPPRCDGRFQRWSRCFNHPVS